MSALEGLAFWALGYLLNSLWMVPLVFAAAWLAARMVRRAGPQAEHTVWVTALLLQVVLPACRVQFYGAVEMLRKIALWYYLRKNGSHIGYVNLVVVEHPHVTGVAGMSHWLATALAATYGCTMLYFLTRLAWGVHRTYALERDAECAALTGEAKHGWDLCRARFEVTDAEAAFSSSIPGPVTVGLRRGLLLLPPAFLDRVSASDLDAVLAHECAHMRRRDFAKNLLYSALSLPLTYHPVLWLTLARIAESREMVCDAMAAETIAGEESYARSLLRLASIVTTTTPARTLHAIGIFDANTFERRVMRLTGTKVEMGRVLRLTTVAACVVVGAATCASALALHMEVAAPAAAPAEHPDKTAPAKVSSSVIAGNAIYQKPPVYPAEAKANHISGAVVLKAIISKEGNVEELQVVSGPNELRASSLDAVREWKYKPFLLNGEPTEVETTITVTYNLGG